jgi:hypothetical protein
MNVPAIRFTRFPETPESHNRDLTIPFRDKRMLEGSVSLRIVFSWEVKQAWAPAESIPRKEKLWEYDSIGLFGKGPYVSEI